jgi:hypothetical protein
LKIFKRSASDEANNGDNDKRHSEKKFDHAQNSSDRFIFDLLNDPALNYRGTEKMGDGVDQRQHAENDENDTKKHTFPPKV